ncbi:lipase family protein [Williamsia sp. CHRR-6]|uniref:lipase family protein n=1 Tax=Williamsia sp. CHRR-6 TaxID=2835871 RepID=UPI001BDA02B3|nr:lipase family protein [Williamsia sp. CHRR-6]MBT0566230.1 lipase [Williamsia sp. CHRR-6]
MTRPLTVALVVAGVVAGVLVPASGTPASAVVAPVVLASRTVTAGPVVVPGAASTAVLRYSSTSITATPTTMTGSLALPRGPVPRGGWPLVVWSHMTVGAADRCAPSTARVGDPELVRMTTGDPIVARLLAAGFAVARPDFEGIGGPGRHPYLIGRSLARSVIDMAVAVRGADRRIGRDVVLAGHSEGAVAALFAAAAPVEQWRGMRVRGVAAITPPTEMAAIVRAVSTVGVRAGAATGDLVGLAALIVTGAATVDPAFAALVTGGGLSARATRLLPAVDTRCFGELGSPRVFGALAPSELLGPRGATALTRLTRIVDANDVAHLNIPTSIPIRVDAGAFDAVAPLPFLDALVRRYRARGNRVAMAVHPAAHTAVPASPGTAGQVAAWLIGCGRG